MVKMVHEFKGTMVHDNFWVIFVESKFRSIMIFRSATNGESFENE